MKKNSFVLLFLARNASLKEGFLRELGSKYFCDFEIKRFPDGETYFRLKSDVENKNVFIVQCTYPKPNEKIFELLLAADACKRGDAKSIFALLPYLSYARQDRQVLEGEAISIELFGKLLKAAGFDHIITANIHSKRAEKKLERLELNIFSLDVLPLFAEYFACKNNKNLCVVAPDQGALKSAEELAKFLNAEFAHFEKRRISASEVKIVAFHGNVKGKECIVIDDVISTAGTITTVAERLIELGASSVRIAATHGLFTGKAFERLQRSPAKEIVVCNTLPQERNVKKLKKLKVLDCSKALCEAVKKLKL